VFSVIAGLPLEMIFMLFSVHNAALWAENEQIWSILANEFFTN